MLADDFCKLIVFMYLFFVYLIIFCAGEKIGFIKKSKKKKKKTLICCLLMSW